MTCNCLVEINSIQFNSIRKMINRHPAKCTAGIGVEKGDTQVINVYVKI